MSLAMPLPHMPRDRDLAGKVYVRDCAAARIILQARGILSFSEAHMPESSSRHAAHTCLYGPLNSC